MVPRLGAQAVPSKRLLQREANIQAGIQELDRWLQDLMRQGLAIAPAQPYQFWEDIAARMVDAQAPGLARRLRECAYIAHSGEGWPQRLLAHLGKLHVLIQGYQRIETLPLNLQFELRTQIGWTYKKEDVFALAQESHPNPHSDPTPLPMSQADSWQVLGLRVLEEDRLWTQRIWLWGRQSDCPAFILNFAYGSPSFEHQGISLVAGINLAAELVFYPSSYPLRALIKNLTGSATPLLAFDHGVTVTDAIARYGQALSKTPWIELMPVVLDAVIPINLGRNKELSEQDVVAASGAPSRWWIADSSGHGLPLHPQFPHEWELLALSGGHPIALAAEWNGTYLWPLSVVTDNRLVIF